MVDVSDAAIKVALTLIVLNLECAYNVIELYK